MAISAKQLIIIDKSVAGYEGLLAQLPTDTAALLLYPGSEGQDALVQALSAWQNLDAVHMVSHGHSGAVTLGSVTLSAETLAAHQALTHALGAALKPGGDLLLYGCDVGAGDVGAEFLSQLARATGADVAASSNMTGAAALGSDWVLERSSGSVEALALQGQGFEGVLASNVTFNPPVSTEYSSVPKKLVLRDVNGDGKLDALLASDAGVFLFFNDGSGVFSAPTTYPAAGPFGFAKDVEVATDVLSSINKDTPVKDAILTTMSQISLQRSGTVGNGHLAGASVFVDYDGDGRISSAAESATLTTTDANGFYELTATRPGGTIVVTGGVNTSTGNVNTFTFRGTSDLGVNTAQNINLTPLREMVTQVYLQVAGKSPAPEARDTAEAEVKQALGLAGVQVSIVNLDPLAVLGRPGASAAEKAQALAVLQKGAQIITSTLAAQASASGSALGTAEAATQWLKTLASFMATGKPIDLGNVSTLTDLFTRTGITPSNSLILQLAAANQAIDKATDAQSTLMQQGLFESKFPAAAATVPTAAPEPSIGMRSVTSAAPTESVVSSSTGQSDDSHAGVTHAADVPATPASMSEAAVVLMGVPTAA